MKHLLTVTAIAALASTSAFAEFDPCCVFLDKNTFEEKGTLANGKEDTNTFIFDLALENTQGQFLTSVTSNGKYLVETDAGIGINDGASFLGFNTDDDEIESDNGTGKVEVLTVTFPEAVSFKGFYLGGFNSTYNVSEAEVDNGNVNLVSYFDANGNVSQTVSFDSADSKEGKFSYFAVNAADVYGFSISATGDADFTLAGICYEETTEVPVPAAAWLFGSALMGLAGLRRNK